MHALVVAALVMQDPTVSALPETPPHPAVYGCARAARPPKLDGDVDDPSWSAAPWSDAFVDIRGPSFRPGPRLGTRVRMLWDDRCLYIGAKMDEPQVWATLTKRDSVIFHDNDFEVFLDPDDDHHRYNELEINALNTVWDLLLPKPYRDGGAAIDAYDIAGLKTSVKIDGTLNDPSQASRGWLVTIAWPWESIRALSTKPVPPKPGGRMRINFSRVQWDLEVVHGKFRKIANRPEHNWVWSPQWVVNMHRPETWGFIEFQENAGPVSPDPYWTERSRLVDVYYRQRQFREKHGRFAGPADLRPGIGIDLLSLGDFWTASLKARDGSVLTIEADSRISIVK